MTSNEEEDYFAGRDAQQVGAVDVDAAVASEAYRRGMADQRAVEVDRELEDWAASGRGRDPGDVTAFLLSACPPAALEELALFVDEEGQHFLTMALQGGLPTAFEIAGYRRRRAAVWARLAADSPRFAERAAIEREAWLAAEGRHAQEAVLRATGESGAE